MDFHTGFFCVAYGRDMPSPHVRGEYIEADSSVACQMRFIPTCVGNTMPQVLKQEGRTVHPHVRGEYSCWQRRGRKLGGSSPRAWGIRTDVREK